MSASSANNPELSIWTPAEWDAAINKENPDYILAKFLQIPDLPAMESLVDLASRQRSRLLTGLDRLATQQGPLTRGARMLLLIDLENYAEVYNMRDEVAPAGHSQADLLDSANATFAVGMAAGVLGRHEVSFAHLLAASLLATSLHMVYREQHVSIELEAVRTVLGDANPGRLRAVMAALPMTVRRFQRSAGVMAEAHMALGDYDAALLASPAGGDLRAFLNVLLGNSDTALDMLQEGTDGDYAPLARSLLGQTPEFTHPSSEPEAGYERIVRGMTLAQAPNTAGQMVIVLGQQSPGGADQRFLHSSLLWTALTDGASIGMHPTLLLDGLRQSLEVLPQINGVGRVLQRFCAKTFLLLGHMPGAHPYFSSRLMDVPLLAGNQVMYQGRILKTPGKTGDQMMADQMNGRETKLHTEERRRFNLEIERMVLPYAPVNLGWVYRGLCSMASHVPPEEREAWRLALQNIQKSISGHSALARCRELVDAI